MDTIIIIIAILFVIISVFLTTMARLAVRPKVRTLEYEKELLLKQDYIKTERLEVTEEYKVKTFDGHNLWVGLIQGNPESKYYVVLSHGYTSSRYGMYKYAVLWKKLGYNCVIYDNRGHGANEPVVISFGIRESRDLMAVIEDTYKRYGSDIRLGLHGESMGAGLQVMALAHNPKVDFIVNDCGYSEVLPVLRWKVNHKYHLPKWLPDLASPYCKLFFGYRFEEVRPIDCLKENEIPICFVHGTGDSFTAHWHSEKMHESNKGYKELHLFEGIEHAECALSDSDRYLEMMKGFVEKVYAEA